MHINSLKARSEAFESLSERKKQVLGIGYPDGGLTDREVATHLGFKDLNAVRPRITELIEDGFLEEIGDTRCQVTGHRVRLIRKQGQTSPKAAPKKLAEDLSNDTRLDTIASYILLDSPEEVAKETVRAAASLWAEALAHRMLRKREPREMFAAAVTRLLTHRHVVGRTSWNFVPGEWDCPTKLQTWILWLETRLRDEKGTEAMCLSDIINKLKTYKRNA